MKKHLFIALLAAGSIAHAETVYTSLEDTPVRDKPVALGSTVVSHLKAGSMVETVKQVGAFTSVSYIQDGKVKTGFIASAQLSNSDSSKKMGTVEKAQTAVNGADVAGMINGFGDNDTMAQANELATDPGAAANAKVDAVKSQSGITDPNSMITSKLDSLGIPAKDLQTFASNGKLVERKPKGKQ